MRNNTSIVLVVAGLILLVTIAIVSSSGDQLSSDKGSAQSQLSQWVPAGTTVQEAKRILSEHHFSISKSRVLQEGYSFRTPYIRGQGVQRDLTFPMGTELVNGNRNEGHWFTSRPYWNVSLFILNGKVTHLFVDAGTKGLG